MHPSQAPPGRLVVCPTPIGNLEDVTLRVLRELAEADVIACEDTRHTRILLDRYGITAELVSYHGHNERDRARALLARIRAGARVALVSDAGTPVVSDPGAELLRACLAEGLEVQVLPGASALLTALLASGMPAERWTFLGFLPRQRGELDRVLASAGPGTLVAFESPRRLARTLALIAAREPDRALAVCRELTKIHEEVRRGSARELATYYAEHPARGEITLVLSPGAPAEGDREQALAALRQLVAEGARPRPAAAAVARLSGLKANELYRALTAG